MMMENHAYDNYLGMLGRGAGQQPRGDGFTVGPDGRPTAANPYPDGRIQHAVSPWSRKGHVTSVVHDHTSILAMAERKWNLPAMTNRDAAAADLTDFLDLDFPEFADPPALAQPPAGPAQVGCEKTGPGRYRPRAR